MDAQFSSPLFPSAARNLIIYSLSLYLLFFFQQLCFPRSDKSWRESRWKFILTSMLNFEKGEGAGCYDS